MCYSRTVSGLTSDNLHQSSVLAPILVVLLWLPLKKKRPATGGNGPCWPSWPIFQGSVSRGHRPTAHPPGQALMNHVNVLAVGDNGRYAADHQGPQGPQTMSLWKSLSKRSMLLGTGARVMCPNQSMNKKPGQVGGHGHKRHKHCGRWSPHQEILAIPGLLLCGSDHFARSCRTWA